MAVLDSVAQAIATIEGYFTSGTRADRNNNPGNIRDPNNTIYPSLPKDSGGFVIFPTADAGWSALNKDLTIKANRGMTLTQAINMYAPSSDGNNTSAYIQSVSTQTGLAPDDLLSGSPASSASAGMPDTESESSTSNALLIGTAILGGVALLALFE